MLKRVSYTGVKESFYSCSNPECLEFGRIYEVEAERNRGWQTDYVLAGIEGHFDSAWFTIVKDVKKEYLAIGNSIPIVGNCAELKRMISTNNEIRFKFIKTTLIENVTRASNTIFIVETKNSIYFVKVEI